MNAIKYPAPNMEEMEIVEMGHIYRVTGSPSLVKDQHAMVEVRVNQATKSYWRRLPYGLKKSNIAHRAQQSAMLIQGSK